MKIFTKNEYDNLICCLVAYPCNLQITGGINSPAEIINKKVASKQYNNLINTLIDLGVKVQFLDLNDSPSQVFTKDIGFVIEDIMFISNMKEAIRQIEINKLIELSLNRDIKSYHMKSKVEGGDILIHKNKIFIGQGERTTLNAVEEMTEILCNYNMNYEAIKVYFDTSKIHLDCVFNILNDNTCIISDDVFNPEVITRHFQSVIRVSKKDADSLALNIINIGNNKVLCCNKNLHDKLLSLGYNSILIDFSEIIKAKGGLGCCVLELLRSSDNLS